MIPLEHLTGLLISRGVDRIGNPVVELLRQCESDSFVATAPKRSEVRRWSALEYLYCKRDGHVDGESHPGESHPVDPPDEESAG